jgi:acetyl-CoA carboxylase carboxyltransferase component
MTGPKLEQLRQKVSAALTGGSESARARHADAGKMMVRERLRLLFDDGFAFEDGLLAGHARNLPSDAIVTCVGKVHGRDVAVIANDMTVKAGSWGHTTFLKLTRMQELAKETGLPLVYLVDSAGARVDEQADSYLGRRAWGNIFYNQVVTSGIVPQVCALFGPSPAGAAYIPALCDLTIMVDKQATAMLGSPRMAKMTVGEDISEEELGGARMHCSVSGLGDVLVETEAEAIAKVRAYLSYLPSVWTERPAAISARPPAPQEKPIEAIVPENQNLPYDVKLLIDALVDEGSFFEVKELFAKELVTGFARLGGESVGILANNSKVKGGVLFVDSSDKATRFIWMCNAFNVPLLFLQDVSGYMIGSKMERAGIIRHGAKLLSAVCESTVPRISVVVRKGYGGGYVAMSGASTYPDALLALPTGMAGLVGPEAAINALYAKQVAEMPEDRRDDFVREKREEYARDIGVLGMAADRFHVEAVVEPQHLRDELIERFAIYRRRRADPIPRRSAVHQV